MQGAKAKGYGLVIVAAALWATMGLFYKGLMSEFALPPLSIVFWRATVASSALFLVLAWRHVPLGIARRDGPLFVGFGLIGVAVFYAVYIYAIDVAGMGIAAVLMYTAPVWVTLYGVAKGDETLSKTKALALFLALTGCALVGRMYALREVSFNLSGVLAGLGAGVTYGSYIVFSKRAAERGYSPWLALAYALGIGALALLPFQGAPTFLPLRQKEALLWLFVLGLVPTLGGGVAFNAALHTVSASHASIIATLEPVLAAWLGWMVWGERLEAAQIAGAGLIVLAVVVLQSETRLGAAG